MRTGISLYKMNCRKEPNGRRGESMDEKARAARNAYKREWNRRNRDKVRKYQETYWSRKAAAQSEPTKDR